ncbi:1-(5-phosphoribosyl)-5-[(5-phosphoribosylamino)methylideneamino] imidazole-4-carboxamide isomerase [Buchnera aphidicola (Eriosoma grossulariae)]|uniref:1-(5-phosphoribosyl)-5-[(5- phosphoribosylamino)methylideneamino]imidazole-4- carboxamide isomerase n=1 Tax=Buchnera aphidicola TaxID=9 RepID=UPI003464CDCD
MIIPSLDLIQGQIVRLYQGNYDKQLNYPYSIEECLYKYSDAGVNTVHIVDLDGAQDPNNKQYHLLQRILSKIDLNIQFGGGVRTDQDIENLLSYGVKKIVIGSLAINNKKLVSKWLSKYGSESIIIALDIKVTRKKEIFINGWKKNTGLFLEDILEYYISKGLKQVLCTDISKDGTLKGSNIQLYQEICNIFSNICFQSSGGIGSLNDIYHLKKTGVKDIIIGRALLEKNFTISEALTCWQKELYLV